MGYRNGEGVVVMKPVAFYVFGTTWFDFMAVGIACAQRWKTPYHVGCYFLMEDGGKIGFEARRKECAWVQFGYMDKWMDHHNDPQKSIEEIRLPLSQEQIEALFVEAKRMKKTVKKYPYVLTLVNKLLHLRRGWPMLPTPWAVDCSEGVARLLYNAIGFDLRDDEDKLFDDLSPSDVFAKLKTMFGVGTGS